MLKAYIDDSNMGQGPIAVLGGWLAPARNWTNFVLDWEAVLRMRPRIEYFKWHEYRAGNGEFGGISDTLATEKVRLLVQVIEEHGGVGATSVISNDLHSQIFNSNSDRIVRNPYFLSFYSIVVQFVEYAAQAHLNETIDFIFDIQPGQMEASVASWDRLKEIAPPHLKPFIGNASFNDDIRVLPLQAADLSAGWTREQAEAFLRGEESPEPPWADAGSKIKAITRTWTVDLYEELAKRTGAFTMPDKIFDPALRR
jgi:hypothetical protein